MGSGPHDMAPVPTSLLLPRIPCCEAVVKRGDIIEFSFILGWGRAQFHLKLQLGRKFRAHHNLTSLF